MHEYPHLDERSGMWAICCRFKSCDQKVPPNASKKRDPAPHLDRQYIVLAVFCAFESCIQEASPVAGQKCDPLTRERGGQLQPHSDPTAAADREACGIIFRGRGEREEGCGIFGGRGELVEGGQLAAHRGRMHPEDRGRRRSLEDGTVRI